MIKATLSLYAEIKLFGFLFDVSLIILLAVLSALTLKPIMKAFEASARLISDSVIPPTEF